MTIKHFFFSDDQVGIPGTLALISAIVLMATVFLIIFYIFLIAAPVFGMEGIGFITGTVWNYQTHEYGILIFIAGTLILTLMTMIIACPIGVLSAIYLAEWAPAWVSTSLRTAIELLVGIPSVVYGIFGFFVLKPYIPEGLLLASVILMVMVLPTIVALSQEAILSVPIDHREGSYALGATKWETIKKVVLPGAFSGILTAVILAMMRAVGETMAIVMLLGNSMHIPGSITDTGYAMTSKILNDMGYYLIEFEPRSALFGIAAVLFCIEILMVASIRAFGHLVKTRQAAGSL